MSKDSKGQRRTSIEQRRVFRTASFHLVRIGQVAGMDPEARALWREWDVAAREALLYSDWSTLGLEAFMLVRPLVLIGNPDADGLHWLANPQVLLALQGRAPDDTQIPAICLAHQVTQRTRLMAAGAGLIAGCVAPLSRPLADPDIHRVWQALVAADANPLSGTTKMSLVRALRCDPRKLPSPNGARAATGEQP
ncbi:hypothetical protein AACH10_04945 [Ideonella sp. DXS22W]|uniref:Uncharacterized protein n=1 Tax=Pseudaquabacterium inlustre TaxID=2984192 RepID=A0ABU9CFT6_9BURK